MRPSPSPCLRGWAIGRVLRVHCFAALCIALLALFAAPAIAQQDELDALLAKERWRESSFGVSFRPPLGSKLISRTFDDAVLRVLAEDFAINVYIKNTQQELNIDNVVRTAIEQFTLDKQAAPQSLDELVSAGYLRQVPKDPITDRFDWRPVYDDLLLVARNPALGSVSALLESFGDAHWDNSQSSGADADLLPR